VARQLYGVLFLAAYPIDVRYESGGNLYGDFFSVGQRSLCWNGKFGGDSQWALVTIPITFQVTLQQGGTVTNPVNGAPAPYSSNAVLVGSIRVQGSPCFTSGATSATTPQSAVEGNMVSANFTMDDGSTLTILGSLTDPSETRIATTVAVLHSGQCGGAFPTIYQLPELDRQS